jgi:hypothetical protein
MFALSSKDPCQIFVKENQKTYSLLLIALLPKLNFLKKKLFEKLPFSFIIEFAFTSVSGWRWRTWLQKAHRPTQKWVRAGSGT